MRHNTGADASSLSRVADRAIERLCRRHGNEECHTRRVTTLAIEIFDGVAALFSLSGRDRALLEAAARLHDVGYARAPRAHVRASALIASRARIPGFTRIEHACIGGVILLHAKAYERNLDHPIFHGPLRVGVARRRALRLGAILRIADGLDHGHVQDARIRSLRIKRGAVRATVSSDAWPGNVAWAASKADLWNEVFPLPLILSLAPSPPGRLFDAVVDERLSPLDTARRALFFLFREIGERWDGAFKDDDARHCHDLRVAIRRFRAVLRIYRPFLKATTAERLRRELGRFADRLGPARDLDVWLRTLLELPRRLTSARADGPHDVLSRAREDRAVALDKMRTLLEEADAAGVRRRVAEFLRMELPGLIGRLELAGRGRAYAAAREDAASFANRKLLRVLKRISKRGMWREEPAPDPLHEYRRLVRRGRYTADLFAPLLGKPADRLAARFKALADALGDHHDASVGLERLRRERGASRAKKGAEKRAKATELELKLIRYRTRAWRLFLRERHSLDSLAFSRAIGRELERI